MGTHEFLEYPVILVSKAERHVQMSFPCSKFYRPKNVYQHMQYTKIKMPGAKMFFFYAPLCDFNLWIWSSIFSYKSTCFLCISDVICKYFYLFQCIYLEIITKDKLHLKDFYFVPKLSLNLAENSYFFSWIKYTSSDNQKKHSHTIDTDGTRASILPHKIRFQYYPQYHPSIIWHWS